jgi:hypothetical protein
MAPQQYLPCSSGPSRSFVYFFARRGAKVSSVNDLCTIMANQINRSWQRGTFADAIEAGSRTKSDHLWMGSSLSSESPR